MEYYPIGTFVNIAAVIVGGSLGLLLQKAFPKRIKHILFQSIGLFTVALGIQMAIKMENPVIVILSILPGAILGELLNIEDRLDSVGDAVKQRLGIEDARFSEGMITAFIIFCIGPLSIWGAIEEGIKGIRNSLFIKSTLDGITSVALASTYGVGVLFSVIPMLIFQGGLTLLSTYLKPLLNDYTIAHLEAVGGIIIVGIGINLLQIGKIKVANFLPSLVIIVALALFWTTYIGL